MQRRCDKNRKRSKRRAIYCPIHGCYIDSVSQKYKLYVDKPGQLQQRGVSRLNALILVATQTAVALDGEWLEAFWCTHCQKTEWYYVKKLDNQIFDISLAPSDLWQQAIGVTNPDGNPSVGEFTRRQARMNSCRSMKDFVFVG
ncbi:hypothetical protein DSM106972_024490 [Dulcicalothrix desertica PCC 7102]|uniref:Uncharacterized protein n=1 Tax=Dulcicalothrix desertica PCC 7102 TaxID=232991 RepID=A0A3S1AQY9_9CYAN|nr:hypothetical protein [Dulcicalothrix desertica]RUT07188.1 hypothetical protein DSM106972_024490 [Dulcicalothrix desertica PCC 7102]TWH61817.1 hypothetical protein CAL7102_00494 [Dulcicalothrix desertica PCC 7102]